MIGWKASSAAETAAQQAEEALSARDEEIGDGRVDERRTEGIVEQAGVLHFQSRAAALTLIGRGY
jgi:hypothetical protein